MSIFPDRQLGHETFKNLLNEADFILTVDMDFVNKSLQRYLTKRYKELPKHKVDELIRKHYRFAYDGFVSNLGLKERNPLFWNFLFEKLSFPKNSNIFIEFIPDYDFNNFWRGYEQRFEENYPYYDSLFDDSADYYSVNFPYISNSVMSRDGINFVFSKMEQIDYYCFDNGTLDGHDEPWYCCDLSHLKISLQNNSFLVSNKSLLDFCILFCDSESEFHPEGELENISKIKWIDYNSIDFKHKDLDSPSLKNEIKKLFDKKRISSLDSVFEEMFARSVKGSYNDFDYDIDYDN